MSGAVVNGSETVKPAGLHPNGPKMQQFKPSAGAGATGTANSAANGKILDGSRKQASPQPNTSDRKPPPKAWQGPNPFTQRSANGTPNGGDRTPARQGTSQNKSGADAHGDKHAHDRTLFLFANFIGKDATVTLKTGESFTGVFSGAAPESSGFQYRLKMVKRAGNADAEYTGEGEDHAMSFDLRDTLDLSVAGVVTSSQQNGQRGSTFLTDTQISNKDLSRSGQRQLQRWEPGPDSLAGTSLEDTSTDGDAGWDQFAANEKMYGVQSTYDEDIYTTTINRNNPDYRRRQAEADRIAREIEGSAPANAHVAEERRRDANKDDDDDEEAKYSGVRREPASLPKRAAGAYVPPSQRAISNAPTVPGAPFDPAIISSSVSKSTATPTPPPAAASAPPTEKPKLAESPAPAASLQAAPPLSHTVSQEEKPVAANPAKPKPTTTEHLVRDTADAFKQFANNEKLRLRQAQEMKRTMGRAEKNVKLNDLKKFAANFKLKSRVPDDLVPILAKDREKQLEIQSKAEEAAKEEEQRARAKELEKAAAPSSSNLSNAATAVASTPAADPRALNQNARTRGSQQARGGSAIAGQNASPRAPLSSRIQGNNQYYQQQHQQQQGFQRPGQDLRLASGTPASAADVTSPSSATRLNVNAKAFEFRPGVAAFAPSGTSPSPQRVVNKPQEVPFFDEESKKSTCGKMSLDTIERLSAADDPEQQKKQYSKPNGGMPRSYVTPPTWQAAKGHENDSYLSAFPKQPPSVAGSSPMHTPMPNGHMPPNGPHGVPMHMAGPAGGRPQYYPQPQMGHPGHFNHLPQFGGHVNVQNSPRQQPLAVAPFTGQMAQMPYPAPPMPGYGMSPGMQYRQLQQPPNPMMMLPGQPPNPMGGPMRPGYPPGPQFPGGHMMVQQHSSSGYNGQGPPPQQPGQQPQQPGQHFSPMPPHAQPHLPPGASFSGSPRPPLMQHQGSHQGYAAGPPPNMYPPPGSGPPHGGHHMGQRAMSNGFPPPGGPPPVMGTPRGHHAMPYHQSPGGPGMVPPQQQVQHQGGPPPQQQQQQQQQAPPPQATGNGDEGK